MTFEDIQRSGEIQRAAEDALSVPVMINSREQVNIIVNDLLRKWKSCQCPDTKESIEDVLMTYYLTPNEFDVMVTRNLTAQEYRDLPESQI